MEVDKLVETPYRELLTLFLRCGIILSTRTRDEVKMILVTAATRAYLTGANDGIQKATDKINSDIDMLRQHQNGSPEGGR